jgi:hypothetical protein
VGTFPFGWIREIDNDNWQLFWDSETKILYAKGAISKRFFNIGQSQSWQEARDLAIIAQNGPEVYLKTGQNK